MEQVHNIAEQAREDLMMKGKEEISSREIGEILMKHLKKVDRVAYVRFASVYRRFEEPEDFRRILREVRK